MKKQWNFLKTTILGGLIFLLPLVLLVTLLGKALKIMMVVAEPLDRLVPVDTVGEIALVNFLALIAVVLFCFLGGFLARSALGRRVFNSVDDKLLAFPGYALFKVRLTGNIEGEGKKISLKPIIVQFDDQSQIAFEVERTEDGRVVVFLPGAPDPWSGSVVFVTEDRVKTLNVEMAEAMDTFKSLGHGSSKVMGRL